MKYISKLTKMQGTPKKIALSTLVYRKQEQGFKEWLATLGYAESTVYGYPKQLIEFLYWLEQQGVKEIMSILPVHAMDFIEYFKNRPNRRRAGGLSIVHINKQIDVLNKFFKYLAMTQQYHQNIQIRTIKSTTLKKREILTKQEVKDLYDATDDSPIGMRDRAMLGVYYGCGLRKSEGLALEISDVLFERRLLYVRQAKNGHERYVPINLKVLQDLEVYIYQGRPLLIDDRSFAKGHQENSLFISERGGSMRPETMVWRLKTLQEKTGNPQLQSKSFGLHALRHSIATHLLQAGMELENIAQFLGHKTLDSTQHYTHLLHEIETAN